MLYGQQIKDDHFWFVSKLYPVFNDINYRERKGKSSSSSYISLPTVTDSQAVGPLSVSRWRPSADSFSLQPVLVPSFAYKKSRSLERLGEREREREGAGAMVLPPWPHAPEVTEMHVYGGGRVLLRVFHHRKPCHLPSSLRIHGDVVGSHGRCRIRRLTHSPAGWSIDASFDNRASFNHCV